MNLLWIREITLVAFQVTVLNFVDFGFVYPSISTLEFFEVSRYILCSMSRHLSMEGNILSIVQYLLRNMVAFTLLVVQ